MRVAANNEGRIIKLGLNDFRFSMGAVLFQLGAFFAPPPPPSTGTGDEKALVAPKSGEVLPVGAPAEKKEKSTTLTVPSQDTRASTEVKVCIHFCTALGLYCL